MMWYHMVQIIRYDSYRKLYTVYSNELYRMMDFKGCKSYSFEARRIVVVAEVIALDFDHWSQTLLRFLLL